ncbi:dNA-directed RNA polymerase specialized sigma subunit sigma24 [Coraliomargarita sp. CAG:312]|nr:dNA-directed RNA polymerase specialized sigma subunit sigma24 [Coraliomargarita sp. CAG:312]
MECPQTPNSVIAALLNTGGNALWQKSWGAFFDTYYVVMRAMTLNTFKKIGWLDVPENDIEEVISQSFISLRKAFESGSYKVGEYRFRGFLKRIISRRTIDYVRAKNKKRTVNVEAIDLVDALKSKDSGTVKVFEELEANEVSIYRLSVIMDVWESIRHAFSPETCLIFEMTQLEEIPVKEVCKKLGVPRTKVDKAVYRIVKRLREELNKDIYRKELEK